MGRWGCKSAACPKAGVGRLVAMQLHGNLTGVGRGCLALNLWKLVWNLTGNSLPETDLEILPGSNILGTDLGNPFPRDSPLQGDLSEEYNGMVLDFPPKMVSPSPFFIWESPVGNLFGPKKHFGSSDIFSFGNRGTSTPPHLHTSCEKFPKLLAFEQIVTGLPLPLLSSKALDKRVDSKAIQSKWQQCSQKAVGSNFLIIGGLQYFTVLISDTECKRNAMELTAGWFD